MALLWGLVIEFNIAMTKVNNFVFKAVEGVHMKVGVFVV